MYKQVYAWTINKATDKVKFAIFEYTYENLQKATLHHHDIAQNMRQAIEHTEITSKY